MEAQGFIEEVYRRMQRRSPESIQSISFEEMCKDPLVKNTVLNFQYLMPKDKNAAILDIGFGSGWFIAAAILLGYQNIYAAEYGTENRQYIYDWSPSVKNIYEVDSSIGDFLSDKPESFAFIHLSHVIEHIPKYHLLFVVDALYRALTIEGILFLRTPNMEGPCALSSLYVTLGHEYGFTGSNLRSLLEICNFDNVKYHELLNLRPNIKQRIGLYLRRPFLRWQAIKHRLFGVNMGGIFGPELNISGKRGTRPALFNIKYR